MSSAGDWCLIESDPGVFTELIRGFGCEGVQVEEIWSLDDDTFQNIKPVHGLIFLFKWVPDTEPDGSVVQDSRLEKIFFAKQVINNACATQAILSVLLNCKHPDLKLGETLSSFKEFSQNFDPSVSDKGPSWSSCCRKMLSKTGPRYPHVALLYFGFSLSWQEVVKLRGLSLSNSDIIKQVHNSFSRQQMFEFDEKMTKKDDDVFHFVGYLPIDGRLYELDGLKDGPIDLGAIAEGTEWLDYVKPILEKRMQRYSADEIHFNLMAIVSDRKMFYEKKMQDLCAQLETGGMETDSLKSQISQLGMLIADEDRKMKKYKVENIRRKHNYLPFIMELLKILAEQKQLVPLIEKAKETAAKKKGEKAKAAK